MKIDIPDEALEAIVIHELSWHLKHTKANRKPPMFSYDPKEEKQQVKHLQDAFKTVLAYYGVKK